MVVARRRATAVRYDARWRSIVSLATECARQIAAPTSVRIVARMPTIHRIARRRCWGGLGEACSTPFVVIGVP